MPICFAIKKNLKSQKNQNAKQQNVKNYEGHQSRNKQLQSPLSPMVNPTEYAPLSQRNRSKDKARSRSFNLEEKFDRLDILGKYEHPTPLPTANQAPRRQSNNHRNQGDFITQSVFDADDRVGPTPAGEGNYTSSRRNRMSSG